MTLQLALLLGYSALLVGIGLWIGRRVSGTQEFFVAISIPLRKAD